MKNIMNGSSKKKIKLMTLEDAKAYMISNTGVKFTCQVFHDEYIMYDERKKCFRV